MPSLSANQLSVILPCSDKVLLSVVNISGLFCRVFVARGIKESSINRGEEIRLLAFSFAFAINFFRKTYGLLKHSLKYPLIKMREQFFYLCAAFWHGVKQLKDLTKGKENS